MTRLSVLSLLFIFFPVSLQSTTAHDLTSRLSIDGVLSDFEADEWVLDPTTTFSEDWGDSRWGKDNDIERVALTWDDWNLYVGIGANTVGSTLMLFFDTACGGVGPLQHLPKFRRNIELGKMTPNVLLEIRGESSPPEGGSADCRRTFGLVDGGRIRSRLVQDGVGGGAFEAAIPWELLGEFGPQAGGTSLPERMAVLGCLAVVTGGAGTGAGDAAPNPSVVLENDSTRLAVLDNHLVIPLDQDGDGVLDVGVSPRSIAGPSVAQITLQRQILPLKLIMEKKFFAPEKGEVLRFLTLLEPSDFTGSVYMNASVYSAAGRLLCRLYVDEPRALAGGGAPLWDTWDGRDRDGAIVPGGIYILAVSGGPAPGSPTRTVKASMAVIR
jgi:hypothetical protein